jgi:hypothetical protein
MSIKRRRLHEEQKEIQKGQKDPETKNFGFPLHSGISVEDQVDFIHAGIFTVIFGI